MKLRERVLSGALALVLGLAALPPGGVSGDVLRGLLVALVGGLVLAQAVVGRERPHLGWGALLFGAPLAMATLQLLPWPGSLLDSLNPALAGLYRANEAAGGAGTAGAAHPATPAFTPSARALLLGVAYLALFAVARARRYRRALTLSVVALAGLVAAGSLFSFYFSPSVHWARRASGPFVNPNHLCAFLALGFCVSLGVLGSRLPPKQRLLCGGAALVQILTIVATRSRAGIVATLVGALVTLAIVGAGTRRRAIGVVIGLCVLGGGLALSDSEALRSRFAEVESEASYGLGARTETWQIALDRIQAAPFAGEGLASYDLQSQGRLDPTRRRWTRPGAAHNDYLELGGDVGLPALALSLFGLVALLAAAARGTRLARGSPRAIRAGALGGVVALLAHSAVDFPLHQVGIAFTALVVFSLALGRTRGRGAQGRLGRWWLGAAGVSLLVAGAVWGVQGWFEEGAREAYAKIRAARPALRAEQTRRVLPKLRQAASWGGSAEPSALLGSALETRSVLVLAESREESRALHQAGLEFLRRAVQKSPGDARYQLQLAAALLRGGEATDSLEEVGRRVRIALERSPTQPTVLFGAAEVALELRVRTGSKADLALAERCLRRGILQRPDESRRAQAIVQRYAAKLGRRADLLLKRVREFEAHARLSDRESGS